MFFIKWLGISAIIFIVLGIAMFDSGNPDSALAGLFLFLIGMPISSAIMALFWWKRLGSDN